MSVLRIKSGNLDVELVIDNDGTASVQQAAGATAQPSAEQQLHVALIALALDGMLSQNAAHDYESGIITIKQHPTEWNAKALGFTNVMF